MLPLAGDYAEEQMTQLLADVDSAPADAFRAPTLGSHVGHSDEPLLSLIHI